MTAITGLRFQEHHYGEAQSQGARDYQEDFLGVHFGVDAPGRNTPVNVDDILLVLADGMGGQNAGDVASRIAVEGFMQAYARALGDPGPRLEQALWAANRAIAEAIAGDPRLKGMGCTLVSLVVAAGQAHYISVGDSILWRFRDGSLTRLNDDHSYGAVLDELARRGEITVEKAQTSPDRSLLRSALAGGRIEEISHSEAPLTIRDHDYFILASDGLLTLPEASIAEVLNHARTPARIARGLIHGVELAHQPDQDNATVQVLCCEMPRQTARDRRWGPAVGLVTVLTLLGLGMLWWFDRGEFDPPRFVVIPDRGGQPVSPVSVESTTEAPGTSPRAEGLHAPATEVRDDRPPSADEVIGSVSARVSTTPAVGTRSSTRDGADAPDTVGQPRQPVSHTPQPPPIADAPREIQEDRP